jgi:hypothetical protein
LHLIWPVLGWLLLAGGCCLEVVVNSGLTVFENIDFINDHIKAFYDQLFIMIKIVATTGTVKFKMKYLVIF